MSEFKREDRYIVIKRSDLDKIPNQKVAHKFLGSLAEVSAHSCRIPQRRFLVIESDWPEYEPAWAAIKARVAGSQPKAGQGEAVAWEYQTFHDDNTVTPGWSAWERVEARHSHETVAGMVAELQDYIARGYRYRLRALYTAPPATADAVSVPRELLEHVIHARRELTRMDRAPLHIRQKLAKKLTDMIAQHGKAAGE